MALLDLKASTGKHLTKSELAGEAEAARCAAMALWSCCKCRTNKIEMRRAGIVPLLSNLLWSTDERTLIPVVGILHECASEVGYDFLKIICSSLFGGDVLICDLVNFSFEFMVHIWYCCSCDLVEKLCCAFKFG